ncbi:MAG TPA: hypothetical protein VNX15_06050 [Gemmatimonadales bacterium]|jgi:hypothetical protein|nr:hypothetical protein [Gemmatimonadales bacterium]
MLKPVAVVAALSLAVAPLHAQDLVALCKQLSHPDVGAWSAYQFVGGREDGATMKLSVVGGESHGDTSYLWIEMAMAGMQGANGQKISAVSKMLVASFGPGMSHPRAMVFKFGTAPAMTMPMGGPMAQMAGSDRTGIEKCGQGKSLGWENVTVPAGTFHALHVQDADGHGDYWVMPSMSLGLIKAQTGSERSDLVLTGHGTGAKDAITETPVPFNPAILMQMMGGQTSH